MKHGTLIGVAVLMLILLSGCVTLPTDPAVGCWETNPGGEGLAMRFDAGGRYHYPIETGKTDSSGGRYILINRNAQGSWERINDTAIRVDYQNKYLMTGEDVVIVDKVVFENSGNSAHFESTGLDRGVFYKTNWSCD